MKVALRALVIVFGFAIGLIGAVLASDIVVDMFGEPCNCVPMRLGEVCLNKCLWGIDEVWVTGVSAFVLSPLVSYFGSALLSAASNQHDG